MLGATLCFAALDATSKHLSRTYPIPMMVWGRYSFHCLMMLILVAPSMRMRLIATKRPVAQVVRALLLVGTTGFSMVGFSVMPLAESTAIVFIAPLVVVMLSHWLLKEAIAGIHVVAVIAGFFGVLLIARPGGALNMPGLVWMLLAAACYSVLPDPDTAAVADREHPHHAFLYRTGRHRHDDAGCPAVLGRADAWLDRCAADCVTGYLRWHRSPDADARFSLCGGVVSVALSVRPVDLGDCCSAGCSSGICPICFRWPAWRSSSAAVCRSPMPRGSGVRLQQEKQGR